MPVASARAFELDIPAWLTQENSDELHQRGNALFVKHDCRSCHNPATTTGNMKLDDVNKRLQYPDLIDRLSNPTAPMPVIALDETEKRAVAVYLLK